MLNFADWVINTDWATPLVLLVVSLLLAIAFIAAMTFWMDTWRELIQEEAESSTLNPVSSSETGQAWQGSWKPRHI